MKDAILLDISHTLLHSTIMKFVHIFQIFCIKGCLCKMVSKPRPSLDRTRPVLKVEFVMVYKIIILCKTSCSPLTQTANYQFTAQAAEEQMQIML